MKKTYIVIIVTIIVIISGVIGYFLFNKTDNTKVSDEKKENNINIEETAKENKVDIDNTISNEEKQEEKKEEKGFFGYTSDEWKNMIKQFYEDYIGVQIKEVICKYDEKGNFTADVATENEVCGEYVFDTKTGFGTEKNIGLTVDFINGKIENQIKDKSKLFKDNLYLAIGYVKESNKKKVIENYFTNDASYNAITRYDFRSNNNQEKDSNNELVIIPKDENVEISIYDCEIEENGEINKKNVLLETISEPFVILYDNLESENPKICIELKVKEFEDIIPIKFNKDDGKIDLTGHEMEIIDISK